jgi:hypothetical protein
VNSPACVAEKRSYVWTISDELLIKQADPVRLSFGIAALATMHLHSLGYLGRSSSRKYYRQAQSGPHSRTSSPRRAPSSSVGAGFLSQTGEQRASYLICAVCEATASHLPLRFTKTSVQA